MAASHLQREVSRVLVVCPINAIQVWPDQMEKHLPFRFSTGAQWSCYIPQGTIAEKAEQIYSIEDEGLTFILLNYDALSKRDNKWDIMKAIQWWNPQIVILDESQKVKNATAKRSKAAHQLGGRGRNIVLLSGTPISRNYLDLYSQLKVIDPRIWYLPERNKVASWTEFRHRYGIWGGSSGYELRGYQNLDDLRPRYKPYISSARKRDCLDLPSTTDVIIPVELNPAARQVYDLFSLDGMVVFKRHLIEAPIVLTKLLRLQQMTGGAVHDEMGELVEFQVDKMAVLKGLVEDLQDANRKAIIFARFTWEVRTILEVTNSKMVIQGGVSENDRKKAVRQFIESNKTDPLVIQIASGEALDGFQHVCSDVVFYSTDYSWDHYVQARGRVERAGQEEPITFYHLHCINTVDKLVYAALREKKNLERLILDDPDLLVVDRSDSGILQ